MENPEQPSLVKDGETDREKDDSKNGTPRS